MRRLAPTLALLLSAGAVGAVDPVLWPEAQRRFLQDGPGLLLDAAERNRLARLDVEARQDAIEAFLAHDPIPETELNELAEGIHRRQARIAAEWLGLQDDRARLLFLHGAPRERQLVECREVFKPLEIWRYGSGDAEMAVVLYRLGGASAYRLWLPSQGKRVLYTAEMRYLLEQWHELGRSPRRRFDHKICPVVDEVDAVTRIQGLGLALRRPPDQESLEGLLQPPSDLVDWARKASQEPLPPVPEPLVIEGPELLFPSERGFRVLVRLLLALPPDSGAVPVPVAEGGSETVPRTRLSVTGVIERQGRFFEEFRVLFEPPVSDRTQALAVDRLLRGESSYLVRLRIRDEISGREHRLARGFSVPRQLPGSTRAAEGALTPTLGREVARQRVAGEDRIVLVGPESPVVLGLWRAHALVSGPRIRQVAFLLDGERQLVRTGEPFTAELRLPSIPAETVARAEGYDREGQLVAADEVVLNRPTGELAVRILEPRRGGVPPGPVRARAEVVVPEGSELLEVLFRLGEDVVARLLQPPWTAQLEVPAGREVLFLAVEARLADGPSAEDVRFLRLPYELEEVEVELVELLTTVTDRANRPVTDLEIDDFELRHGGQLQKIRRFETVRDRPLSLAVALDTSTSMSARLGEASQAAVAFLRRLMRPRDSCFAVAFANRPALIMPRTRDLEAVESALDRLVALGHTALHDAVVFGLHHFRGVRGRRALVVLTDGEDTRSTVPFEDALAYAVASGVVVYTIAFDRPRLGPKARAKLNRLAERTGGRAYFVGSTDELDAVYRQIAEELRSQYLLAYSPPPSDEPAPIEVDVRRFGLSARTVRNYVP